MKEELVEADVLCIGGGIAGLMAGIRAGELGATVIIVEKGNINASGLGRSGNDHFECYIPEVHGPDIEFFLRKQQLHRGVLRDRRCTRVWAEKSFDIVKLWDSWGIPMKHEGKYEFAGHGYPGSTLTALKYSGQGQKQILVNEALKRGVKILNRIMVFDLLRNDTVIGAIGISTREDNIVIFKAKSIILGTGCISRLYPSTINGWISTPYRPITLTGDGRAMAYRAGAELVGLDMSYKHCGPKYFARSGQATWVGVIKDADGQPIGPFVTKPDRRYGDPVLEIYPTLFEDYAKSGKGPVYMDCRDISDEDYDYMLYFMRNEGFNSFLKYLDEEGINLKENPIEFMRYEIRINGGVYCNEKAETSLKGLYAAGDEMATGISNAAIFGWIAGENAAAYAKDTELPKNDYMNKLINEKVGLINTITTRGQVPIGKMSIWLFNR